MPAALGKLAATVLLAATVEPAALGLAASLVAAVAAVLVDPAAVLAVLAAEPVVTR